MEHLLIGAGPLGQAVAAALVGAGIPYRHVQRGTSVASVRYREADALWDVRFSDSSTGTFRGLIVADPHRRSRVWPAWTGPYPGAVLHGRDYLGPDPLRGKRVLVVGGGQTGSDIVRDAASAAASVAWSLRRGYWFLPPTLLGRPALDWVRPRWSARARRALVERLLRLVIGRHEDHGLPAPDHALFEGHPSPIADVLPLVKRGRILVRPDVADADGDEICFVDGARARYDLVVCATGCRIELPYLPEGMVPFEGRVAQLHGSLVRPGARHLYVLGTQQVRFDDDRVVAPTARRVARWIRLQDRIAPTLGEVLEDLGMPVQDRALVEAHAALRQLWLSEVLLERLVERHARKMAP